MTTKAKGKMTKGKKQVEAVSNVQLPVIRLGRKSASNSQVTAALHALSRYDQMQGRATWAKHEQATAYMAAMDVSLVVEGKDDSPLVFDNTVSEVCSIHVTPRGEWFLFMDKHGVLYSTYERLFNLERFVDLVAKELDQRPDSIPSAMQLRQGKKTLLLLNGDQPGATDQNNDNIGPEVSLVEYNSDWRMPVVSFNCLERLLQPVGAEMNSDTRQDMLDALAIGDLVLRDYLLDETVPFSAKDKKLYEQHSRTRSAEKRAKLPPLLPPQAGFTKLPNRPVWHRSGAVLFEYGPAVKTKRHFLLGQDEGTYFGCELSKPAKSVTQAYETLVPPEARKTHYKRQGEWFVVPFTGKLPPVEDRVLMFSADQYIKVNVYLPLETPDSVRHLIEADEGFVSRDGRVFARNPSLEHDDHSPVKHTGWCRFFKNTALRSVSQQDVD